MARQGSPWRVDRNRHPRSLPRRRPQTRMALASRRRLFLPSVAGGRIFVTEVVNRQGRRGTSARSPSTKPRANFFGRSNGRPTTAACPTTMAPAPRPPSTATAFTCSAPPARSPVLTPRPASSSGARTTSPTTTRKSHLGHRRRAPSRRRPAHRPGRRRARCQGRGF